MMCLHPHFCAVTGSRRRQPRSARTVCGVSFIAGMVSMLPVRLYSEADGKTKPLADPRTALINDDTGDLLDGVQLKAALVTDYLLNGRAYAYVAGGATRLKAYITSSNLRSAIKKCRPDF